MSLGAIGAVLAVLVIIFIIGRAWYAIVEGVLSGLKRLFGKRGTGPWHTLPAEPETKENDDV